MDAFSKIRKTVGREEQKRQMINKAIDLLHKLANKRLDFVDAKSEISRVISEYYVIDDEEGMEGNAKIHLEVMINNAFDVISGVKEEKLNLYQAIMLMNKVMAHTEFKAPEREGNVLPPSLPKKEVLQEPVKTLQIEKKEEKVVPTEVKTEKVEDSFSILMNKVIENKTKYHNSIEELNELLKGHGLLLSTLEPK